MKDSDRTKQELIEELVSLRRRVADLEAAGREAKRMEEQLAQMATHDPLTGLPNRALLYDHVGLVLARARRSRRRAAVLLLDLDHFKSVNDTLGHSTGDALLQAVGSRLKNLLRESDTVARLGGDEFVVLLSDLTRVDHAIRVADKVLDAVRKPFTIDGREIPITTSIGIAAYPDNSEGRDALMKNADTALYEAKRSGRDRYACFSPETELALWDQ